MDGKGFYYENELKICWKLFYWLKIILLYKLIRNDFIIENSLRIIVEANAFEIILLQKPTENNFMVKIHWKWFYDENLLKLYRLIGLVSIVFANNPGDLGSIRGRVIPKVLKMLLDTSLLNTQHIRYVPWVKWSNTGKGVAPSHTVV